MINGPEGFTPDNEFILGESDVRGLFVAAGFCAHGIAGAGGIGRQVASWIVDGEPELDLWKMDIRRFGPQYRSRSYTLARSVENYATYYDIHYPNEERQAGRPLRVSPAYARLAALGASFGEKASWERANWFEPNAAGAGVATAADLEALRPRGWAGRALEPGDRRRGAGDADDGRRCSTRRRSPRSRSSGPGAAALLQWLCANDVDRAVGSVTYTQLLNRRGGIECDLTVTRVTPDRFLLVTGTAFGNHDLGWIRRHAPRDGSVLINDLTSGRACYALWGPRARDILASTTTDDVSDAAFPYLTARAITVGDVPVVRAARHVRRRARLGAVRARGVRRGAVGHAVGRGRAARAGRGRVPGDRRPAAREGLPRLGRRHHARGDAVRGRARVRGGAGQAATSWAATRWSPPAPPGQPSACAASCSTIRARSASATSPSASRAGSSAA